MEGLTAARCQRRIGIQPLPSLGGQSIDPEYRQYRRISALSVNRPMRLYWQGKLDPSSPLLPRSLHELFVNHDARLHGQCGGWQSIVRHPPDRTWK